MAAASLGSVVRAHGDGKLVRATKLAPRHVDKVRKEQEPNVSPPHMNLNAKEEDVQDEGTLFNRDCASSLQKTYGGGTKKVQYQHSRYHFS